MSMSSQSYRHPTRECLDDIASEQVLPEGECQAASEGVLSDERLLVSLSRRLLLVLLGVGEEFSWKGAVEARCIFGQVEVLGSRITSAPPRKLFSPASEAHLRLRCCEVCPPETVTVDMLQQCLPEADECLLRKVVRRRLHNQCVLSLCPIESVSRLDQFFPGLFGPLSTPVSKKLSTLGRIGIELVSCSSSTISLPDEFCSVAESLLAESELEHVRVLVAGPKGAGKSSFCRFLVNKLLARCPVVCFLDCDPGQPEFSLSGCVSLVWLDEPLLGPHFTHLWPRKKMSLFMGAASAQEEPALYLRCVEKALGALSRQQAPLIINTMGWNQGVGGRLLRSLFDLTQPSHVVQLQSVREWAPLDESWLRTQPGWLPVEREMPRPPRLWQLRSQSSESSRNQYTASEHRALRTLSYLHGERSPSLWSVPLSSVGVHVFGDVPWSQALYAVNASLVALCRVGPDQLQAVSVPAPKVVSCVSSLECLGFGLVQAVDSSRLHVYTALSAAELSSVNAVVRGSNELPEQLFRLKLKSDQPAIDAPYVYSQSGSSLLSGKAVRQRRLLRRRKRTGERDRKRR